ncbi:hypothetical protein N8T08_008366 [Aspergillus melleus]|uniref:Uncharacterized protein n=1 Tax=Aspergillus melleus TaxID=138277 RepID=A0ACC3AVI0_9EURO|nr:hypothetical protein N8T08_008366 [Aspergillus melleus]
MSTSQVLYEPIESVERMEYYQGGGYHPVEIGDHFHDRYRVVHKLGHGTYSTIWLARDEISHRYVAVKICAADSGPLETDVLSQLSETLKSSDIGTTMMPSILDRFNIQGPNAQRSLFEGFLTNEDDMTCQQIAALGPLPTEWWEKWEGRGNHFTDDGEPNNRATSQYRSLEDAFELKIQKPRNQARMPPLELSERNALLAMLRPMLSFKPENRSSVQQVLESEWMVKWAIPEFEKIRSSQGS